MHLDDSSSASAAAPAAAARPPSPSPPPRPRPRPRLHPRLHPCPRPRRLPSRRPLHRDRWRHCTRCCHLQTYQWHRRFNKRINQERTKKSLTAKKFHKESNGCANERQTNREMVDVLVSTELRSSAPGPHRHAHRRLLARDNVETKIQRITQSAAGIVYLTLGFQSQHENSSEMNKTTTIQNNTE